MRWSFLFLATFSVFVVTNALPLNRNGGPTDAAIPAEPSAMPAAAVEIPSSTNESSGQMATANSAKEPETQKEEVTNSDTQPSQEASPSAPQSSGDVPNDDKGIIMGVPIMLNVVAQPGQMAPPPPQLPSAEVVVIPSRPAYPVPGRNPYPAPYGFASNNVVIEQGAGDQIMIIPPPNPYAPYSSNIIFIETQKDPCAHSEKELNPDAPKKPCPDSQKEPSSDSQKEPCSEPQKEPSSDSQKQPCSDSQKEPCPDPEKDSNSDVEKELNPKLEDSKSQ